MSQFTVRETFHRKEQGGDVHATAPHPVSGGRRHIERFDTIETGLEPNDVHAFINSYNIWPVSDTRFVSFGPMQFQGANDFYRFAAEGDIPVGRPIGGTLWGISDPDGIDILGHAVVDSDVHLQSVNTATDGSGVVFVERVGDSTWAMFINQMSFTRLGWVVTFEYDPDNDVLEVTQELEIAPGWGTNSNTGNIVSGGWNQDRAIVAVVYDTTAFGENGERIRFVDCDLDGGSFTHHDFMVLDVLGQEASQAASITAGDTIYCMAWLTNELAVLRFDLDLNYLGRTTLDETTPAGGGWTVTGMSMTNDPSTGVLMPQDPQDSGTYRGALVGANGMIQLIHSGASGSNPFRKRMRTHRAGQIIDFVFVPPDWTVLPSEFDFDELTSYGLAFQVVDAGTGERVEDEPIIWQTSTLEQLTDIPPTRLTDTLFFTQGLDFLSDIPENDQLFWTGVRWFHLARLVGAGTVRGASTHLASDSTIVRRVS